MKSPMSTVVEEPRRLAFPLFKNQQNSIKNAANRIKTNSCCPVPANTRREPWFLSNSHQIEVSSPKKVFSQTVKFKCRIKRQSIAMLERDQKD